MKIRCYLPFEFTSNELPFTVEFSKSGKIHYRYKNIFNNTIYNAEFLDLKNSLSIVIDNFLILFYKLKICKNQPDYKIFNLTQKN